MLPVLYFKIRNIIKKDKFLKNSLISFLGVSTITLLNYSYHPIVSKLISVVEYGEIQTILTLIFISSILNSVTRLLIVNIVANKTDQDHSLANDVGSVLTLSLITICPIILLSIISSQHIQEFFYLESNVTIILFSLYLFISIPYTAYNSYLQGVNDHKNVSFANIIISTVKLAATLFLLYIGLGVNGAIFALSLSIFAGFVYSFYKSNHVKLIYSSLGESFKYFKREYNYIIDVFLSTGFITLIYSVDMLIIKRVFDPLLAGGYGGIATIGKTIFFLTAFISPVISSSVKLSKTKSENLAVLGKSFKILLTLCIPVLALIIMFKNELILSLLTVNYLDYSYLLIPMSVLSVSLSVLYILISYLLALKHKTLRHVSLFGVIMLTTGVNVYNDTMLSIIYVFLITSIILNVVCFYLACTKK